MIKHRSDSVAFSARLPKSSSLARPCMGCRSATTFRAVDPHLGQQVRGRRADGRRPGRRPVAGGRSQDRRARAHGRPANLESSFLKGALKRAPRPRTGLHPSLQAPRVSIPRGCRLMRLPRSTFYDASAARLDDAEIVGRMQTICDEFEAYGYRRVGAELRHQGVIVNHKKIRRLMREHGLNPSAGVAMWLRPTVVMIARSFPIAPAIWSSTARTSVGGRHHLYRDPCRLRLSGGDPRRLVASRGRLRDQPLDRCQARARRAESRHPHAQAAEGCVHHSDRGSHMPRRSIGKSSPIMALSGR